MLNEIRSDDSVAEKSFTGIETRPKEICPVAMGRGIETPLEIALIENHSQKAVNPGEGSAQGSVHLTMLRPVPSTSRYARIWEVIRRIPPGRVATYGQIAELAGLEGHARQVGYALHALPSRSDVPWHRVINSRGEISPRSAGDSHELQRLLLEAEGIAFDLRGRVDLSRYRWRRSVQNSRSRPCHSTKPNKRSAP
jgi:methylated-DNA-protein-cysteine methyltransferase related protein